MFESVSAISAATLASTPRWFAHHQLDVHRESFLVSGAHSTSSHFSGSPRVLRVTGQSWVWIDHALALAA